MFWKKKQAQHAKNCQKLPQTILILIGVLLCSFLPRSIEATCYSSLKLPRTTGPQDDDKADFLMAIAVSDSLNAVFVGGMSESDKHKPINGKTAVIFRLDLAQNTWTWRKAFTCSGCQMETTTAIAVSGDGTMVAGYATRFEQNKLDPEGYFFTVRATDGHYLSGLHKIVHGENDKGNLYVPAGAMHFDSYGVVYMAFGSEKTDKGATNVDVDSKITDHVPKFAVAGFTGSTGAKIFYHHLGIYFGEAYAVTYADYGSGGSNLYVGGMVDTCYYADGGPTSCFSLQIARIKPDGLKESQRQIFLEGGSFSDKRRYPLIDNIEFQNDGGVTGEWLFGTTRNNERDRRGEHIYVWRCDLDANHDPRSTNLEARQIDDSSWSENKYTHVTGMYQKMVGSKVYFVIYLYQGGDTGELRYVEFDFNSSSAKAVLLYADNTNFWWPKTVFMGSATRTAGTVTIYESYTVASLRDFVTTSGTTSFGKEHGAILPSILTNSCMKDESSDVLTFTTTAKTPSMGFSEQEFGANVQKDYLEGTLTYQQYDFIGNMWNQDSWCSTFPAPPALTTGSVDQNLCFRYDDDENTFAFNPITYPSCADTGIIITYAIDITPTTLEPDYFKVSLDPYNNLVRWTGLTGGTQTGTFALTVTGTLPDSVTETTFTVTMIYSDCEDQAYTPSTGVTQIYYVTQALAEYEVPDFGVTLPLCPVTYANSATPVNTWLTGVSDYLGVGKKVGWSTITEADMGTYTIQIDARDSVCLYQATGTMSYTLEVRSQCWVTTITIDSGNLIFASPALTQNVHQPSSDIEWSDADVTTAVVDPLVDCGAMEFSIVNSADESAIDSTVFTTTLSGGLGDLQRLSTYTIDSGKVGTYNLRVKAWFTSYNTNVHHKDFTIVIADGCETPTLTAATLTPKVYIIYDPEYQEAAFTSFLDDPLYCPITYSTTISPALPASILPKQSYITLDQATRVYSIFSDDLTAKATYTVTTEALTPLGVATGVSFAYSVDMQDPCELATLTIDDATLTANPYTYIIGQTADVQTFFDGRVSSTELVANCPSDFTFTVTKRDGTALDATIFTYNSGPQQLSTYNTDISNYTGASPIQLTAHVAYNGYAIAGTLDFDVNLDISCDSTTLAALTISDMSFDIFETPATQTLADPTDTVSGLRGVADGYTECGNRVYSITTTPASTYSNFLTIDADSGLLTLGLAGTTYGDEGTYTIEVTVALEDYPTKTSSQTFVATVNCPPNPIPVYTPSTTTIDLLVDQTVNIAVPQLATVAQSCWTVSWGVEDASANDMLATMPTIFTAIDTTQLTFTHTAANFADRLTLYGATGSSTYTFKGTFTSLVAGYTPNPPADQTFQIDYTDACRTASVESQTLTMADVRENRDASFTYTAFSDTVDTAGVYSTDICGAKTITLTTVYSYLNLINGSDLNNFQIDFVEANAYESDVGVKTINYNVIITEYSGIATAISGSFSLEILCAGDILTFTEETGYSVATQTLDLLSDVSVTVRIPTVTYTPTLCITLTWKVFRKLDNLEVSSAMSQVFSVGATELTVTHSKDNFSRRKDLFGEDNGEFYWKGFLNDYALTMTSEFPFEFAFTDDCRTATIVAQDIIFPVSTVDISEEILVQPFTDSLDSVGSYDAGICGEKRLTLDDDTPDFLIVQLDARRRLDVRLALSPFTIYYDHFLSQEADAGTYTINYTVSFMEYADVMSDSQAHGSFIFEIIATCALTEIIENERLPDLYRIYMLDPRVLKYKYKAYTDSVSEFNDEHSSCGQISYTVINRDTGEIAHPENGDIVDVQTFPGTEWYFVTIDTRKYTNVGYHNFTMYIEILDQPEVAPLLANFTIEVIPRSINEEPVILGPIYLRPESEILTQFAQCIYTEQDYLANEIREKAFDGPDGPRPYIYDITQTGIVDIRFTRKLMKIPNEIDITTLKVEEQFEPCIMKPVLNIYVEPALGQDPDLVKLKWKVIDFDQWRLKIKIDFETPLSISFEAADTLVIDFYDENFWLSHVGSRFNPKYQEIRRLLMRQLPLEKEDEEDVLVGFMSTFGYLMGFCFIVMSYINFVKLRRLLEMVGMLQIVAILPLINTSTPANAGMVWRVLWKIVSFDLFEVTDTVRDYLEIEIEDPVNERFETLGIESKYFINNMGFVFFLLCILVLLVIIWTIFIGLSPWSKLAKRGKEKLSKALFWRPIIVIHYATFLIIILCALLSFKYKFELEGARPDYQTFACFIFFTASVSLSLFFFMYLIVKFDTVFIGEMRRRFGVLYMGYKVWRGLRVLVDPALFLVRRFILSWVVVQQWTTKVALETDVAAVSSIVLLLNPYLIHSHVSTFDKRLQTFSEFCFLTFVYLFYFWNKFTESQNFDLGYLAIAMLYTYMSVMLGFVIWGVVQAALRHWRMYLVKRTYMKNRIIFQKALIKRHRKTKSRWIHKLWKRGNLDELKKAADPDISEESVDNRSVVFSIHVTSSEESVSDVTSELVTSYEESEELQISQDDGYEDDMNYAHLAPLANLINLAGAQQSFDSTSTKKDSEQPADYKPGGTSKSFKHEPQSLQGSPVPKAHKSATDVLSNSNRSIHSRGMSEVKLLDDIVEEEPQREETVNDAPAMPKDVNYSEVGRDKHKNILGELEDLLGPFEEQKIRVNDQIVREKTMIMPKSARSNQVQDDSPEKAELEQDLVQERAKRRPKFSPRASHD